MKKKTLITRKTIVTAAIIGSLVLMTTMIVSMLWASKQVISATDEAVSEVSSFYLEAMADRRAKTIINLINNDFDHMEKALLFIEEEDIRSQDDLRIAIGKVKSLLSLDRFALVDEDDIVYTQYTTYTGGSRHAFLFQEKMTERTISTVSLYGSSKQLCLAMPTPDLVIMGKKFKACFVQIDIREIVNLLAFEDEGRTYFGVYSNSGENLSDTELGPYVGTININKAISGVISETEWHENQQRIINGETGSISFTANGADETLCYVPIQGTDWWMVVLIRESVIHDQIRDVSEKTMSTSTTLIVLGLVLAAVISAVMLRMYRIMAQNELEEERKTSRNFRDLANTDSMTGVRNKHAYSNMEAAINHSIAKKETDKLAVVVCDINGLKHVNDTQGHAAGDKLIKDACAMICEYFNHGSVFRIGGDEFVVILQDKGYETLQDVLDEFNRKVEENLTEDKVVVSVGHSELTERDTKLKDVFERADQEMYARKQELKAMGAKTRS